MNVSRFVCVALLVCVYCVPQAQPARDPFVAAEAPAEAPRGDAPEDYTVHGILLLRGHALAALKTPAGEFRIVGVGDVVGSAGDKVARITVAGVHVRTATGIQRLPDTF